MLVHELEPERRVIAAADDEGAAMGERPLKVRGWRRLSRCEHSRGEHEGGDEHAHSYRIVTGGWYLGEFSFITRY